MEINESQKRWIQEPFPKDFPERLELFRETAGLSWKELAARVGVRRGRMMGWRRGAVPQVALHCWPSCGLARRVPGGMEALFPDIAEALRREEGEE